MENNQSANPTASAYALQQTAVSPAQPSVYPQTSVNTPMMESPVNQNENISNIDVKNTKPKWKGCESIQRDYYSVTENSTKSYAVENSSTEGKKTVSFKLTAHTLAEIETGAKKYSLSKSELITFAVYCLTNELDKKQIDKLIEDKKRTKNAFG